MEDELFIDPNDGMACHLYYNRGEYPWCVRLIDTDSGNTVGLRRFRDCDSARAWVRKCLHKLTLPAVETL